MSEATAPPEIGPYQVRAKLGEGGMGIVYLAIAEDGREVAVKLLRPHLLEAPGGRRRFEREVEAVRRAPAFCTAPLLDYDLDGPEPYLVTEYVEGPGLDHYLHARGPLRGAELHAFAAYTMQGLHSMHALGIVHRDLKPSNVLLGAAGPRIIDFGIARLPDSTLTTASHLVGTPAFMSPEQVERRPVTAASDVFSWGSLVAYAATGRAPFGTGQADVFLRIRTGAPDLAGMDEGLLPLVRGALEKDPAKRMTSAEILAALTLEPAPQRTRRARRGWRWAAGLASGAALVATFLALRYDSGRLVEDDFDDPASGWQVLGSGVGIQEYGQGYYVMRPQPGFSIFAPAPRALSAGDVDMTAVAQMDGGSGLWGVWCRGHRFNRYEFYVSELGDAYISTNLWRNQDKPHYKLARWDPGVRNTIRGRCRTVSGGVELTMWVNGVQILSTVDRTPFPPGQFGFNATTWGGQKTNETVVRVDHFEAHRP